MVLTFLLCLLAGLTELELIEISALRHIEQKHPTSGLWLYEIVSGCIQEVYGEINGLLLLKGFSLQQVCRHKEEDEGMEGLLDCFEISMLYEHMRITLDRCSQGDIMPHLMIFH